MKKKYEDKKIFNYIHKKYIKNNEKNIKLYT